MKRLQDTLKEKIAILRLKKGDSEAFGFLYDEYVDKIDRYVLFRVSHKELAHDITQEVFLTTWEYLMNEGRIDHLQSFLYRVAYRRVVDVYRDRERQTSLMADIEDAHDVPTRDSGKDTALEMHFLMQDIRTLKDEYQDILILRHVEGLSISEIASILEKDANNVRVTLHRAITALKDIVDKKNDSRA